MKLITIAVWTRPHSPRRQRWDTVDYCLWDQQRSWDDMWANSLEGVWRVGVMIWHITRFITHGLSCSYTHTQRCSHTYTHTHTEEGNAAKHLGWIPHGVWYLRDLCSAQHHGGFGCYDSRWLESFTIKGECSTKTESAQFPQHAGNMIVQMKNHEGNPGWRSYQMSAERANNRVYKLTNHM